MTASAFTPTVLTIPSDTTGSGGQGELNLITNPVAASDLSGWVGAGRGTSGGPLNPTIGTYFTVLNTAGSESSTSGAYDVISLPSGLQNKKLKVEFYFTSPATDVFKVSVYKGTTRVPLTTDVSGTTSLPQSTTGKFVAYFDTDSSGTWTVSITRTAGTGSTALQFTNVVVGPGIQPQGAVVGEWQSYSLTVSGLGAGTGTGSAKYRRVGDSIQIAVDFQKDATPGSGTSTVLFSLPTNLSIDSSKITAALHGTVWHTLSTITSTVVCAAAAAVSTSAVFLIAQNSATNVQGASIGASQRIRFNTFVPIAEWAGSGTVQLAQNDVEYASNDGTNNVYGPIGTAMPTTSASAVTRTVTFQTPIQDGDKFTLEYRPTLTSQWSSEGLKIEQVAPTQWATYNSTSEGGWGEVRQSSSTQVVVVWRRYRNGTTNWAGSADGYWRVRKSSAGAAVGFGIVSPGVSSGLVSAAGLPGRTNGLAVASGYVGEKITGTPRAITCTAAGVIYASASACLTLNKGIYLVFVRAIYPGVNAASFIAFGISSTATTRTPVDSVYSEGSSNSYGMGMASNNVATTSDSFNLTGHPYYLNVAADNTPYYGWAYSEDQAGLIINVNMAAIRIA